MSNSDVENSSETNSTQQMKHEKRKSKGENQSPSVQYQLKQVVGKGSYGVVYRAVNKKSKQTVAIKEINYDNDEELKEIMIEIDLLKNLNHINIVKYHGFIQKQANLYIILEYASHGSLKSLFAKRNPKRLEENETTVYIKQTLHGLNYLHEQGVIHRDIKAANLLLDSNNIVKLADFGVSTMVNNTAMTLAGSLNWMAPEIITNKGASTLSDIWSLGATVVELMTGNPPFHNLIDINIYYAIENDKYYPPSSLPDGCKHFLKRCFQKSMYRRPTAKQLLKHPWLRDVNDPVTATTTEGNPLISRKENKLSRFKESDTEIDQVWDSDFIDSNDSNVTPGRNSNRSSLTNFVAKRATQANINGGNGSRPQSPLKNNMLHRSPTRSPVRLGRYMSTDSNDMFEELTRDINELEEEVPVNGYFYLGKIRSGVILSRDKLAILFHDCKITDIVECILEITDKKYEEVLINVFEYDYKENNCQVQKRFINYGGLARIMDEEEIISRCILVGEATQTNISLLIQCGVMNHVEKYTKNPRVYFELIYAYLEVTSIKFWYQWCNENLDCKLLVNHLSQDKKSQSIMIKLSSWDNRAANVENTHWVLKDVLPLIITRYPELDSLNLHYMYIVLKSITLMLQTPYSEEPFEDTSSHRLCHSITNSSSNAGSPIKSKSGYLRTFRRNELRNSTYNYDSISSLTLPKATQSWLLSLINNETTLTRESNIHIWKYFTKVCYTVSHLDSEFLTLLYSSKFCFVSLQQLLDQYNDSTINKKSLSSILRQWLLLLVEMSRKKKPLNDDSNESQFFQVTISFMSINKFSSLGVEIILNMWQRSKIRTAMVSLLKASNIIPRVFYEFDPEDIDFSTFISRFTKLASLHLYETFPQDILCHESFMARICVFFETYESSVLIQLDLLKLLKVLFLNSDAQDTRIHTVLEQVVKFLDHNWKQSPDHESRQVGGDSVLLIQLCNDLRSLASSSQ